MWAFALSCKIFFHLFVLWLSGQEENSPATGVTIRWWKSHPTSATARDPRGRWGGSSQKRTPWGPSQTHKEASNSGGREPADATPQNRRDDEDVFLIQSLQVNRLLIWKCEDYGYWKFMCSRYLWNCIRFIIAKNVYLWWFFPVEFILILLIHPNFDLHISFKIQFNNVINFENFWNLSHSFSWNR